MKEYEIIILDNSLEYLSRNFVFPKKKDRNHPGIAFYSKFIAINLSIVMFLAGIMSHLIVNVKKQTYINIDLDLALVISIFGSYMCNFSYLRNVQNTINLYKRLSDFYSYGIPNNFDATNSRLNFLSKCHYIYITFAVLGLCTAPLLDYENCKQENIEKYLNEICGFVGGIWFPFELDTFPYRQMYYLFQIYSSLTLYQTSSMICFSVMETVEHVIVRLRHVADVFNEALTEENNYARRHKFNNAVSYHVAVIDMTSSVNTSFNGCMFVHVLFTGAILGCLGYRLVQSCSLDAMCLFIGWLISMIIVSISGQRLRDQSLSIGDSIYRLDWQNLDRDIRKDLMMVIMRCQKPMLLHAGPFGYMNYAMIMTVLKTSYSYLTLLSRTS